MKHILIITYNDYPVYEGLGVRIKNLSRVFIEKGHEVTIFAPNIDNRRIKEEYLLGCRIIRANIYIPAFLKKKRVIARALSMVIQTLLTPFVYIKHLKNKHIDLIQAEHIYSIPPSLVIRAFTRKKIIVDDISTVSEELKDAGFSRLVKVFILFEKTLFKYCYDFISTSAITARYYKARGAKSTIFVSNGVNCDDFKPVETNSNKVTLFFNGSTYSSQNTEAVVNFIKIGKTLMEKGDNNIQLSLICWPEYNLPPSVLHDIKNEKKWLSFKEGVERIETEIGKADITLLPYGKEHKLRGGVRLKSLEYMACGKLVISTAQGVEGIIGLIPNEHFILAESIDQFPLLITDIINDPEKKKTIAKNARKFVLDNYDWRKTTSELTDRIDSL